MKTPDVTATQYLMLSGFLDGPRTVSELRDVLDLDIQDRSIQWTLKLLCDQGLIEKIGNALNRRNRLTFIYQITQLGRQSFRETLDFFVFIAKQADGRSRDGHHDNRQTVTVDHRRKVRQRRPTVEEEDAVLAIADQPFAVAYCLLKIIRCIPRELQSCSVEDCDIVAGTIDFRRRRVHLTDEALETLRDVIGDRTSGPLVFNKQGKPFGSGSISSRWMYLRDQLGIPKNVTITGGEYQSFFSIRRIDASWPEFSAEYLAKLSETRSERHLLKVRGAVRRFGEYLDLQNRKVATLSLADVEAYRQRRSKDRNNGIPIADSTIRTEVSILKTCLRSGEH